jgi:hypothetical protein
MTNVQQQKLLFSERWKHRRVTRPKAVAALASTPIALMPSPPPMPAVEPLTAMDRARIARWVAAQIVTWPTDRCLGCRRPIVYGAKWVELVNENDRARFHADCLPAWRAQQELAARRAMGLAAKPQPSGAHT